MNRLSGRPLVLAGSSLLNALLAGTALIFASRNSSSESLAAYFAGVTAMVLISVALTGGAGLRYVASSSPERRALVRRRIFIAFPTLLGTAIIVSVGYGILGYVPILVLLACLSAIANNLAEIPMSHCHTVGAYGPFIAAPVVGKVAALALVVSNVDLSLSLLLGNLLQLALLVVGIRATFLPVLFGAFRTSERVSEGHTRLAAYGETGSQRLGPLVATVMGSSGQVASYGVVLSLAQAGAGALSGAAYPLAIRRTPGEARDDSRSVALLLGLSAGAAAGTVLAAPLIVDFLGIAERGSVSYLSIVALWIPVYLLNRIRSYRMASFGRMRWVSAISLVNAVTQVLSLAVLLVPFGFVAIPLSLLLGEVLAWAVSSIRLRRWV